MTQNDLKTDLLVLCKRPGLRVINMVGLGLGIAASVVIVLSARHELTYDPFREKEDRTDAVYKDRDTRTGTRPVRPTTNRVA